MTDKIRSLCPFLSDEQYQFYKEYFNDVQKNKEISFEDFKDALYGSKYVNKDTLEDLLKTYKQAREKKYGNILDNPLKIDDYFRGIEYILKEQEIIENQNDPEMLQLFNNLSNNGDYLYKKNLKNILILYELPLNIEEFFEPLKGQEEINFNEFCALFRKGQGKDEELIRTFYSTFVGFKDVNANSKVIEAAHFPVKYVGHYVD